ncbi:MAG: molybdopterin-dependent oxidoreductase [Campylobacterales bacterium]|nr:molybdopterin-dependent oxidoreductase [Campylobacterales bacterium]
MKNILILLSLCLSLFAADKNACGGDVKKEFITTEISVFGSVLKPQKLNVAKLKELNTTEVSQMAIVCGSGETKESSVSYKGVKLIDVLDKVVVDIGEKHGRNKIYVVATASDGYKALFSYQELENSVIGDKVVVFYEKNGAEVPDYEGKIGLISANDKKAGPRHIKWLKSIEVVRIK